MSHGIAALKWKTATLTAAMAASLVVQAAWAQDREAKGDLHLPQDRRISFNQNLTDGAGYTWDLQYGLTIGQGLNYIYNGGGMRLQVRNSNLNYGGQGFMNSAGDEIEIGPMNLGGVQVYRRCKVYKDVGLARWLDIFVNTTGQAQNLPMGVYSNINVNVAQVITASGEAVFGEKDFAFITEHQGNQAALLHIPCGPKSKLRPTVAAMVNNNTIGFNYDLTVPANGAVIICYFEGQGRSGAELKERLKAFRASAMLKDLSGEVRKLIANFPNESELGEIELARTGAYDTVVRKNGDIIYGQIANESFTVEAFYGTLPLPAKDVIGFAEVPGQDQQVRAVLSGGQVITGRLKDNFLLLKLPTGGELKIGLDKLSQCSYRISKEKPQETVMKDPLIVLRSGDRLAFEMGKLACTFQTRHGQIALRGQDLAEIKLSHDEHGVHRVCFSNQSVLAGVLGPEQISLPIKYDPRIRLDIPRDMILSIRFPGEPKEFDNLACLSLNNEDKLYGQLKDAAYEIDTEFGPVTVKPCNVVAMNFDRNQPSWVAMKFWNGSTLRGRMKQQSLKFQIQPGPELDVNIGQIASLDCPEALPPEETVKQVEKLVGQLEAANFKDRQEAQEALEKMGPMILPLLKKALTAKDPEARQRLTAIIEKLGGSVPDTKPPPAVDVDEDAQGSG